jgi:DNA-binding response OmpR family regulator
MRCFAEQSIAAVQGDTMSADASDRLAHANKKILVVDDDADLRLALHVRLSANNYDVVVARDGVEAIAETRKHVPDLIILDLGLPAGDGFTVMERLKANIATSLIPVIVLSARDRVSTKDRCLNAGARAFLQKPIDDAHLVSVIRQTLHRSTIPHQVVYDLG